MSSISSLSGGISQFIQNLNPSGAASATSNASAGSTTAVAHHHHHGGGFSKLADAVESALQSASNSSSGSTTTDANETITQALTKIFQNGSLNSTSNADGTQASTAIAANGSSGTTTAGPAGSLPPDFVETLKSFGVTPQQFQTDLATALTSAQQTGQADLATAFQSFSPGAIVDTLA